MVALAALIRLPLWPVVALSVAMIALHNALDFIQVDPTPQTGFLPAVWMILHQPGPIFFTPSIYGLMLRRRG